MEMGDEIVELGNRGATFGCQSIANNVTVKRQT